MKSYFVVALVCQADCLHYVVAGRKQLSLAALVGHMSPDCMGESGHEPQRKDVTWLWLV